MSHCSNSYIVLFSSLLQKSKESSMLFKMDEAFSNNFRCIFAIPIPFQVQLNEMTKEMSVFLNSMEITPNVSIVNETFNTLEVTVLRGRNNSFTFSFLCGIGLTTTVSSGILSVVLTVPEDLNGTTQGLLGNFNGNIIDDFMYPNGTVLTDGASDREIHDFGQSCEFVLTLKVRNYT